MRFFSTNHQSPWVDFREATILGQAPDKGLYFPEHIPFNEPSYFQEIERFSNEEIAFRAIRPYTGDTIPEEVLFRIVSETVNFPIPLIRVTDSVYSLELFHGNTLAFKDIGARFMSRCLGYFVQDMNRKVTVLVATSGDTGGAVADGFFGIDGVQVVILYPKGKVSRVQEKQLTTYGGNIRAIAVNGTFDDCQRMVKEAFMDEELKKALFLTSANSINVARWLPQQFFYFFAWKQWAFKEVPPVISVPSGNVGNICAGLLARQSGLPIPHFIAACNANDVLARYMQSGKYEPRKAVATISNAMDVGDPSNFVRIRQLFSGNIDDLPSALSASSYSDSQTEAAIFELYKDHHYLADPHGAVGYLALRDFLQAHPGQKGIFLETAHPVKFFDVVEPIIDRTIDLPDQVKQIMNKEETAVGMQAETIKLKEFLLDMN
jgi:threonine synthase